MKKVYGFVLLGALISASVVLGADDDLINKRSCKHFRSDNGTVTTIHETTTVLDGLVIGNNRAVTNTLDIFVIRVFDLVPLNGTPSYDFETLAQTLAGYKTLEEQEAYINGLVLPGH